MLRKHFHLQRDKFGEEAVDIFFGGSRAMHIQPLRFHIRKLKNTLDMVALVNSHISPHILLIHRNSVTAKKLCHRPYGRERAVIDRGSGPIEDDCLQAAHAYISAIVSAAIPKERV